MRVLRWGLWCLAACSSSKASQPGDATTDVAGDAATTISTGAEDVACLVIDDTAVYWSVGFMPGTVWTAPLAGGPSVLLATDRAYSPCVKAIDSHSVYWVNGSQEPHGVPIAGGTDTFYGPDGLGSIATNGTVLVSNYLNNGVELWFTRLSDGMTSQMNPGVYSLLYLAIDATYVYFTGRLTSDGPGSANMVARAALSGGFNPTVDVLYTVPSGYTVSTFALAGQDVYVIETMMTGTGDPNTPGDVVHVPLSGGGAAPLATGVQGPIAVGANASTVFWSVLGGHQFGDATIMRMPRTGGVATPFATGALGPIAVGTTTIAWPVHGAIDVAAAR